MNAKVNPFFCGGPVIPSQFLGRTSELRKILDRLFTGQSVAVTGLPHSGKTSLLACISDMGLPDRNHLSDLYSSLFCFIDAQLLGDAEVPSDFWRRALLPLEQSMTSLYWKTKKANFEVFALKHLFTHLHSSNCRLVLIVDEFEATLSRAGFNGPEFYGSLRSLASTTQGLSLVVASRYDLASLNHQTMVVNPHGSPYFNTLAEVTLGCLEDEAIDALVQRLEYLRRPTDLRFVRSVSGCQPYLAQVISSILWDLRTDGVAEEVCYVRAGKHLCRQLEGHFADCWRLWSNATKQVLTTIALNQIPNLLGHHQIRTKDVLENIVDYSAELLSLEAHGILAQAPDGEWIIKQEALLWWIADEVRRSLRAVKDFESWLREQELDSILTKKQKIRLEVAAKGTLAALGQGTTALIEAFARGFGASLAS